jgi:hypothetical protein
MLLVVLAAAQRRRPRACISQCFGPSLWSSLWLTRVMMG